MASSTEQLFSTLLRSDRFKNHLFPYLSTADICALRSTSSSCCSQVTKRLFTRVHVTFTPSTFTKQCRLTALARIGQHIEHLTFYFPHSEDTFLPPLIHPETGNEISFLYTPLTSLSQVLVRPKYGNSQLGEILTQQYPPLFHSATNVPSFINAMKSMPNMRHLTVWCPGQEPQERYRRNIVDYALISLRISLERAPLTKLSKLSLSSVHPGAFNYLRHVPGYGSVPSSSRRWKQIKKLYISVEAWDFYGASPGLDHLKVIDDYLRSFAPTLEKLSFTWRGSKGPCPVALSDDPLFAPGKVSRKLFHEVTSPMSPLPEIPMRSQIHFPKLRFLQIRNAAMNAPQLKGLIRSHRDTVKEFDFANVVLTNKGNWDEALSPLDKDSLWSRSSSTAASSEASFVSSDSSEDLSFPSAAAEAASRDLLDEEFNAFHLCDEERDILYGLPQESTYGSESSLGFTTKFTRKHSRRRRKHPKYDSDDYTSSEVSEQSSFPLPLSIKSSLSFRRHKRKESPPTLNRSFEYEGSRASTVHIPIIGPILNNDPKPVLLQPAIYDPSGRRSTPPDESISTVQRNIEQEEAHRHFAEDAGARISALRKAKQAVLTKLSREFYSGRKSTNQQAEAVAACRFMASREFAGCGMEVIEDHRGPESQSLMVPLLFARA
ncbi:unnamed protein product [Clonostachys rhizophaga]|uniref:Uncharacterized protein n=1 Tax=Clonostachys rhizophaga TaxID=160324 RepID=A0A9N9VJ75_9HYPO|nr:unnamed protein product [Clonostachys rhizophaga]